MEHEEKIVSAVKQTLPAVISIAAAKDIASVEQEIAKMGLDPNNFTERLAEEVSEEGRITISSGSAFIVGDSGIVLTNKHVIQDKNASYRAVIGKNNYEVSILGIDPLADIAILKIKDPPHKFPIIALGISKNIRLGQTVIAIGNA